MSAPPHAPPGWYPEGPHLRWWDGAAWGPYAPTGPMWPAVPQQSEEERGRGMAVISHLGFVAGGFILPLVLYLIEQGKPDRNRFVCHHACEALNFAITFMIVWLGGFVVLIVSTPFLATADPNAFPWSFAIVFPLLMLSMLSTYVFGITAMVRANKGVWWRYPISIRLVGRGIDWQTA